MTALRLLDRLETSGLVLRVQGEKLSITGDQQLLSDPELMGELQRHKAELIELLEARATGKPGVLGIPEGCTQIEPAMIPLVDLDRAQLDTIAAATPGGAANIQDIYPLAPLQEGIFFHHLLHPQRDPYVLSSALRFDDKARLDHFLAALGQVIARHDILRTAVVWEGLPNPLQVVWRRAPLAVELLELEPEGPDVLAQLEAHAARACRIDVRHAPLLRGVAAFDPSRPSWLLVLRHHHLVVDHVTLGLLVREIALLSSGRHAELPAPVPFRTFVARARRGGAEHQAFFRQMLADVVEPTAPFGLLDVQGDGQSTIKARSAPSPELSRRLRQQAVRRRVSAASVFHLAWAQVLARATGREDVVFGTVLFGRLEGGPGAARAVGMLLNTLPVRLPAGNVSVEQGLARTHTALLDLLRHEHASLALAQRESGVPADKPLFTALLNYRYGSEGDAEHLELPGVEYLGGEDRTNYPCALHVDDLGAGFLLSVEAHPSLSAERVLAQMLQAIESVVHALTLAPDTPLHALDVLPGSERALLLETYNDTRRDYPAACLHELFERQVLATPEATALEFEGRRESYGSLDARANQLAHHLRELGVGPDERVAICMDRSIELVVALLATLKAGGAYVPLDPSDPTARVSALLADSGARVLLTQARFAERSRVPSGTCRVVLDACAWEAAAWGRAPVQRLAPSEIGLQPSNLAYVIYTSGSSGRPKAVMNEHRGVVNRLRWQQEAYELRASDVVLQKTPYVFDVSIWEFFWPLMTGARLLLARPEGHKDPAYLSALIENAGVTTLHFVPSMLQLFASQPQALARCRSVVRLFSSGEALPGALVRTVLARLPHVSLYNLYGPTEAAVEVTAWTCRTDELDNVPIGRPIANTHIYILDARSRLAPLGVAGEICIGGVQVARGYLDQPELTEERFVADPFVPGARLYKTGDIGRWREDGALEYLGRNDFQVKIRGVRVDLGEIEAQLEKLPGVQRAVVVVRRDPRGGPNASASVVAYVVAEATVTLDPAALRLGLAQFLPEALIPAAFVQLPALPLTPTGKVDRRALPEPDDDALPRAAYAAPEGEVEAVLAQIWAELLRVERVGRRDSFFELGGHSLLAVQLFEQLRRRGWSIDIRALFARPTLAAVAAAIEEAGQQGTDELRALDDFRVTDDVSLDTERRVPAAVSAEDDIEEYRL